MRFTRTIEIQPGHDYRAEGGSFSCAELLFVLTDTDLDGAATFGARTNWLPLNMEGGFIKPSYSLKAIDITYHFPAPTLTVAQTRSTACPFIGGQDCHAIIDYKSGAEVVAALQTGGSEAVWRWLERHYLEECRINNPRRKEPTS